MNKLTREVSMTPSKDIVRLTRGLVLPVILVIAASSCGSHSATSGPATPAMNVFNGRHYELTSMAPVPCTGSTCNAQVLPVLFCPRFQDAWRMLSGTLDFGSDTVVEQRVTTRNNGSPVTNIYRYPYKSSGAGEGAMATISLSNSGPYLTASAAAGSISLIMDAWSTCPENYYTFYFRRP